MCRGLLLVRCHNRHNFLATVRLDCDDANSVIWLALAFVEMLVPSVILLLVGCVAALLHQYHDTTVIEFVSDTSVHPTRIHCRAMTK